MGIEGESHAPLKQGEEGAGIEGESRAPLRQGQGR